MGPSKISYCSSKSIVLSWMSLNAFISSTDMLLGMGLLLFLDRPELEAPAVFNLAAVVAEERMHGMSYSSSGVRDGGRVGERGGGETWEVGGAGGSDVGAGLR